MSIALSVRQKLIAIVVLVCVGYAGFGAYSIYNLSQMSNASDDATELSRLTSEVKDVEIDLLTFEREMATLSHENVEAIRQTLERIKKRDRCRI
jgi:methyl-accepting chemotaxis protein